MKRNWFPKIWLPTYIVIPVLVASWIFATLWQNLLICFIVFGITCYLAIETWKH